MSDSDLAERMTDLEVRLAYQDRTVAALDEVVRELAGRIAVLERDVARLRTASATATEAGS
jgi:uncharacterized coiled-coil protein SlyX